MDRQQLHERVRNAAILIYMVGNALTFSRLLSIEVAGAQGDLGGKVIRSPSSLPRLALLLDWPATFRIEVHCPVSRRGPINMASRLALLLCADEEVHDLAASWLGEGGMRAISAHGVDEALRQIAAERIDLLVLDTQPIYMPGLPSLRKLKDEQPDLRVIMIPRIDEPPEVGLARISGVDAVLLRPVSKAKLLSAVADLRDSAGLDGHKSVSGTAT